ncbi:MAG: hypothetical protein HKL85_06625 [Acidimicrobiaceae bacterium]|nr:hypothetical protein [Acidimicrobiaceae bacterium]
MLALIVALFWLAILAPWAVVKFRNARSEKSIDHFHAEHEVLSRQGYSVAPSRRLDEAYLYEEQAYEPEHEAERSRPRLTVVQDDDTYSTLESRTTWDEWERDYDYEQPRTVSSVIDSRGYAQHRYAAYASAPMAPIDRGNAHYEPVHDYGNVPLGISMRVRRNRIFTSLGLSAVVSTGLDLLVGLSLLQYLAVLSWIALVFYVAAGLFAISQGYLEVASLLGRRTTRAFSTFDDSMQAEYEDETYDEEAAWETTAAEQQWPREPRRYALG